MGTKRKSCCKRAIFASSECKPILVWEVAPWLEARMLDRSFVSTLSFHTTRALLQNKNIDICVISLDTSIQSSSLNPKSQYFTVWLDQTYGCYWCQSWMQTNELSRWSSQPVFPALFSNLQKNGTFVQSRRSYPNHEIETFLDWLPVRGRGGQKAISLF